MPKTRSEGFPVNLFDTLQRPLRDLRISVTDKCNFRCVYCMPKEVFGPNYQFADHHKILSFEEIERLAKLYVALGVKKIRLTGGEPLLRRQLESLIEKLARIDGIELTLTTNGSALKAKARALKDAGLNRITVSLDALDDKTFSAMNDVNYPVERVLEGIAEAKNVGLTPIKINMVVKRGVNDHSVIPMAKYFRQPNHILRIIEYMDVGHTNGWRMDDVASAREIIDSINAIFPLEPVEKNYPGETANRWRYRDGAGEIGVIASVTQAFCHSCTRARVSTEGMFFTCLFATQGHDLRALLRGGYSDIEITKRIVGIWNQRNDRYSEIRTQATVALPKVEMSYIGG